MADKFLNQPPNLESPASDGFAITPSNSTIFPQSTRFIYVGGAGTLTAVMSNKANSNTVLTFTVVAGQRLDIRAQSVLTTTTATNLVGVF